jgi:anti-sigma regulatory factor (Ser/Thr protein kinase)
MNEFVHIERFRKNGVKLIPVKNVSTFQLPIELVTIFEKYDKEGCRFFALDLIYVTELSDGLIVAMLEMTSRLRRRGGDLTIFNLQYSQLEDLLTFNPKKYLAIAENGNSDQSAVRPQLAHSRPRRQAASSKKARAKLPKRINRIEIPYNEDDVYKVCDFVLAQANAMGFSQNELSRIKIAVYEACLNAIQHTRKMSPGDNVTIEVETAGDKLQINVYDRGLGFKPDNTHDYDVTEAASNRKTGGMGLHIIRRAMDEVDYHIDRINGNKLIMIKHLNN